MARSERLRVWLLDQGKPGHLAQSEGVLELLRETCVEVECERLDVKLVLRGWMRRGMKSLVNALPPQWSLTLIKSFHRDLQLPKGRPDVILGSGGSCLWLMKVLRELWGVRTIYAGYPGSYPPSWFDIAVSPLQVEEVEVVETPGLITGLSSEVVEEAARSNGYEVAQPLLVAVLVGGSSRSQKFTQADWKRFAQGLNELGSSGSRFLLTTSRRTGEEAERILRENIDSSYLEEVVWWGEKPKRVMQQFLGRSTRVIVTKDSLTMVSEAIDSGRLVWVVCPDEGDQYEKGSFLSLFYAKLESLSLIRTVGCEEVSRCQDGEVKGRIEDWEQVVRQLEDLLVPRPLA